MTISIATEGAAEGGKIVINVNGVADEKGSEELRRTFNQIQTAPPPIVTLNLNGITQIGSSAIGNILLFYKNLGIKNSRLEVAGLSPVIYELFQELKLDALFSISKQ